MRNAAIEYLKRTYRPRAILLYGSYQYGGYDEYSDFDCMIVSDEKTRAHDSRAIGGVFLDCRIVTAEEALNGEMGPLLPAYDAEIAMDDGIGQQLQQRVRQYVRAREKTDSGEKERIVSRVRKALCRMQKPGDEGNSNAVSLLSESLGDYFLLRDLYFFGSRKAEHFLEQNDPAGFALYRRAIALRTAESIREWAEYVIGESKPEAAARSDFSILRGTETWQQAGAYYVRIQAMAKKHHITLCQEFDGHDGPETKYVVVTDRDFPVATARMYPIDPAGMMIGRVVVLPEYRHRGIGTMVVRECEKWAAELGSEKAVLESRDNKVDFYRKLGYAVCGEPSDGDTFRCVRMEKSLR
ncbi:MAG: GNAT family N-acetyltransferase [Clostridia bacterium]|nr:GNAT family N-acetyltransferase [Clostridia bacterium]